MAAPRVPQLLLLLRFLFLWLLCGRSHISTKKSAPGFSGPARRAWVRLVASLSTFASYHVWKLQSKNVRLDTLVWLLAPGSYSYENLHLDTPHSSGCVTYSSLPSHAS